MRFISRASVLANRPNWRSTQTRLRFGIFLAVIVLALTAILLHERLTFDHVGYAGLALTVIVASGGLVLPVPALATACTAGTILTPLYVGLVAGTAGTLGELTGYYLGYSGQGVLEGNRLYIKMEGWMQRRGVLLLFLVSLIPNPFFDVVGIAAGALRYPLWRFLGVVWVGKVMKFLIFAYACAYSVEWLTDLFGV
jgi:membrane protein YqaA with SNARE-associated domain